MNHSAEICALLVDNGSIHIDAICDRVGLDSKVCYALIGNLSRDGTLRWDTRNDYVSIAKSAKARELAEKAKSRNGGGAESAGKGPPPPEPKRRTKLMLALPPAITVEKGVPLPPPRLGMHKRPAYPWPFATMEIGDSFAISVPEGVQANKVAAFLASNARRCEKKQPGLKFTIRIEEGEKSVRCWRIEASSSAPASSNGSEKQEADTATALDRALARVPSSLGIRARKKGGK